MHSDQWTYRELVETLLSDRPRRLNDEDLLDAWLEANPQEIHWLADLRARPGNPIPEVAQEERWRLYALSRILDLLLLRFQEGPEPTDPWRGPDITLTTLTRFATTLGLDIAHPTTFCPFDHEIVHVEPVDGNGILEIVQLYWPRLMLDSLLIVRAGVGIRASPDLVSKPLAERSTLFWTYRRRLRQAMDRSHGWGSNSQWRTEFRRDYRIGHELWLNVDGDLDLTAETPSTDPLHVSILADDALSRAARIELLANRCLVRSDEPTTEPCPHYDRARLHQDVGRVGACWSIADW